MGFKNPCLAYHIAGSYHESADASHLHLVLVFRAIAAPNLNKIYRDILTPTDLKFPRNIYIYFRNCYQWSVLPTFGDAEVNIPQSFWFLHARTEESQIGDKQRMKDGGLCHIADLNVWLRHRQRRTFLSTASAS